MDIKDNMYLIEIFVRDILRSLPAKDQQLYQYIEELDQALVARSSSADDYLELFEQHSPYRRASETFGWSMEETKKRMETIDKKIGDELTMKLHRAKWMELATAAPDKKQFLFYS